MWGVGCGVCGGLVVQLDVAELRTLLRATDAIDVTHEQAATLARRLGGVSDNGDAGGVTRTAFLRWSAARRAAQASGAARANTPDQVAEVLFALFDDDNSGTVTLAEVRPRQPL